MYAISNDKKIRFVWTKSSCMCTWCTNKSDMQYGCPAPELHLHAQHCPSQRAVTLNAKDAAQRLSKDHANDHDQRSSLQEILWSNAQQTYAKCKLGSFSYFCKMFQTEHKYVNIHDDLVQTNLILLSLDIAYMMIRVANYYVLFFLYERINAHDHMYTNSEWWVGIPYDSIQALAWANALVDTRPVWRVLEVWKFAILFSKIL